MAKDLHIGIAGLGTVGGGVIGLLKQQADIIASRAGRGVKIIAISGRDSAKDYGFDKEEYQWFDDPVELAKSADIDIFIEVMGGADGEAYEAAKAALHCGKALVTANKAMLATHGLELAKIAEANSASIYYEASIGGAIPAVKTVREALAANKIVEITGILNGTCNYILTTMRKDSREFDDVLKEAQDLGYAEADPAFDIEGVDSAHKLALLASIAFSMPPNLEALHLEGITEITLTDIEAAEALGYRIKLLARAWEDAAGRVFTGVFPALISQNSLIAGIEGVLNMVIFEGDYCGKIMLTGAGAGGEATASAVVADIIDIARGVDVPTFGVAVNELKDIDNLPIGTRMGAYYIRLTGFDGGLGIEEVALNLADAGLHISQAHTNDDTYIFLIADVTESAAHSAFKEIKKFGDALLLRVEDSL